MIVRNYFEEHGEYELLHGGEGKAKNVRVFSKEDFETNLNFIIYTELDPNASIGYHTHGENEEVYVILEGSGEMTVNGETRPVKPGDVLVNKMGWSHGLANTSELPLKILVFEVVQ
jgi:mannose-6-phosphate isomerase-like protein (cupin superfamily)